MRKYIIFASILGLYCSLYAQMKITEFQAGFLMPEDAKTGFMGGISFGRLLDENIGFAFEFDYYGKTYTQETKVPEETQGQIEPTLVITEIEYATTMIPIFFKLLYHSQIGPNMDLRVGGGIGWEFMWNSETNHFLNKDETRYYNGFVWQIGGGLALPLSRASDLFAEVSYHKGTPSRDLGKTEEGLPVRTEVDMTGLLLRLGIRLYNFGL